MNPGRARVSLIALALVLAGTEARSACLTKGEARRAYPGAYLYWVGGERRGQRCWGLTKSSRLKTGRSFSLPVGTKGSDPENGHSFPLAAVNRPVVDEPKHGIEPPLQPAWETSLIDQAFQRLKGDVEQIDYSTFWPGQPPEVWPQLERETRWSGSGFAVWLSAIMVLAVVALWPSKTPPRRWWPGRGHWVQL